MVPVPPCHGKSGQKQRKYGQKSRLGYAINCTLFLFDNAANLCLNSPFLNPKQNGELHLVFNFGANPGVNFTVILYREFQNLLEIDRTKALLYDIYQC